jgi:hypothetical protein
LKPDAPCRKISRQVKDLYEYERNIDEINNFLRSDPPDLLLDESAGRIASERSGGRIGCFPLPTPSTMVLHAHISPAG